MSLFAGSSFPIIETKRIKLRKLNNNDVEALIRIWSDERVTKYLNITTFSNESTFTDEDQVKEMIEWMNQLADRDDAVRLGLELKETGELIGTCGFNEWSKSNARASIGYELSAKHWRKGFMSEVIEVLLHFGFHQMGLNRIEATVEPDNIPSIQLLKKFGFLNEGLLRGYEYSKGRFIDLYMFAILKNNYLKMMAKKEEEESK